MEPVVSPKRQRLVHLHPLLFASFLLRLEEPSRNPLLLPSDFLLLVSPSFLRLLAFAFLPSSSFVAFSSPRACLDDVLAPFVPFWYVSPAVSCDCRPGVPSCPAESFAPADLLSAVSFDPVSPLLRVKFSRRLFSVLELDATTPEEEVLVRCLADMWTRNPKTLGTYAESGGSRSGTRLLNVIRNKCGKVVPKAAPSTPAAPAPP